MDDAVVAVAVRDKDVAIGGDGHVGWFVEVGGVLARLPFRAEAEQQFAVG